MSADLPSSSTLAGEQASYAYRDCQRYPLGRTPVDGEVLLRAFAQGTPRWAEALMRLRNRLVGPLGLKTGDIAAQLPTQPFRVGDRFGVFRVQHLSGHEAVLGDDDRHLDFRVSLLADAGELRISTLVRPHNLGGRLYLLAVLPFHHLIARKMARNIATMLNASGHTPKQQ